MIENISLNDPEKLAQWDGFVHSHPLATSYHLSSWIKTICQTYSFEPFLYVWRTEKGDIEGVFPFFIIKNIMGGARFVSMPFSDYGGPVCKDQFIADNLMSELFKGFENKVRQFEIRGFVSDSSIGFIAHNYYKRYLLFFDDTVLKNKLKKRTIQYSIRKSEKAGIAAKETNSPEGMEEFYRLNVKTRRKHGVPCQPKAFFKNLLNNIILTGDGFILSAVKGGETIASSIYLRCGQTLHYKFNASDPAQLNATAPNHLLNWHAVEQAGLRGCRLIDFGRTSPDNNGLVRFKKQWGSECIDMPYFYYPSIKGFAATEECGLLYKVMTGMWRSLPENMVKKIGPFVYKYIA